MFIDWFAKKRNEMDVIRGLTERVVCNDGFSMSVQASEYHYCSPRLTSLNAYRYNAFEVGFPSEEEVLLSEYEGKEDSDPTENIYLYVPLDVIEEVVKKHGGIKGE